MSMLAREKETRCGGPYLKIVTQGFLGSLIAGLHSDLENSKCRIQYGGHVNLINFYKPRPDSRAQSPI